MMLVYNTGLANADSTTANTAAAATNVNTNTKKTIKIAAVTSQQVISKAKKALKKISGKLTAKKIFKSSSTLFVVNKNLISNTVETGGGAVQALTEAPGINVAGYSPNSGLGRSQITMRGVKVGWSSATTNPELNGIQILFDGIPMNNLDGGSGSWDSNELPIAQFISGINVIYGPANPNTRWWDSLGGTINFIPVQPTMKMYNKTNLLVGSFDTYTLSDILSTGMHDGWGGVVAAGYSHADTFRTGQFNAPGHAYEFFGKIIKIFNGNSFSVGALDSRDKQYRPNDIPVSPVQGLTTQGLYPATPANATLYSQQTSGFYSSLPENVWFKQLTVDNLLVYSKLNLNLSPNFGLHTEVWYKYLHRLHNRISNFDVPDGQGASGEYWHPVNYALGERLSFDWKIPNNDLKFGEYYIWSDVNYDNSFYPYSVYGPFNPNNYQGNNGTGSIQYNDYSSFFIQDRLSLLNNKLKITPGVDYVGYGDNYTYNNNLGVFPALSYTNLKSEMFRLEPTIGVNYLLFKNLSLYGQYSISYQNPTSGIFQGLYNHIYNEKTTTSNVQPMQSIDGEIGFKILIKRNRYLHHFIFNANYFQDSIGQQPQTLFISNLVPPYYGDLYVSYDTSYYNGVSIYAGDNPFNNLHVYADYTKQAETYKTFLNGNNLSYNGYPISQSPTSTFNSDISYIISTNSSTYKFKLWDQYMASQYLFNSNTDSPTNQTMPAYNILNASINLKTISLDNMIPGLKTADLTLSVYNLLNKEFNSTEYISSGGYFGTPQGGYIIANPGAPRMFFISATMKF